MRYEVIVRLAASSCGSHSGRQLVTALRLAFVDELFATATAFRRYGRLIVTLLIREEEIRRRAPVESILNLLEPVVAMSTLGFLAWFLGRRGMGILGDSPFLFYATGFFAIYFFIYVARRIRSLDAPKQRFPIEQRLDHIFVHIVLRIADYSILGILVFGTIYFFFTPSGVPHDIVPVVQSCVAIILLGFGWGIFNLVVGRLFKLWTTISNVISRSLIILSGAIFVPDFLAPSIRNVIGYNPLLHAVALFRHGFYPHYPSLLLDTNYLVWCAGAAAVGGLILERVSRRIEQNL